MRRPDIRWGLCCLVLDAPHAFRSATHAYVWRLDEAARRAYLDGIAVHNARTLGDVLRYCRSIGIRAFRIVSGLFPLATHPLSGYGVDALPSAPEIRRLLAEAGRVAVDSGIRLSFHPDQFVVLNSARPQVAESSIRELEWQAEIAEIVGADVICLHGGSGADGIDAASERLLRAIDRLSPRARTRLALENDDRSWGASDLLPVCMAADVPLVLDAHHHRVLSRGLPLEEATDLAIASWDDREPCFHLSSPRAGWEGGDARPHADFIDVADVPEYWLRLGVPLTVDVEAKAKERAVLALQRALSAA